MDLPDTLADDLYDFAFCPDSCYERLVDLANPEPWGEGNRVLKNYLLFSFKRAVQLTKRDHATAAAPSALPIVFDEGLCLFNTGLYTRRYETVYALFEPNTREDARQRWFLKGFFKESDPALLSFEFLPCRVHFAEDPSELVFDYRLPDCRSHPKSTFDPLREVANVDSGRERLRGEKSPGDDRRLRPDFSGCPHRVGLVALSKAPTTPAGREARLVILAPCPTIELPTPRTSRQQRSHDGPARHARR